MTKDNVNPTRFDMSEEKKTKKVGKWYFGGTASAGAACCTHPLDLLKVGDESALP